MEGLSDYATKSPYDLKPGERFRYGGEVYEVLQLPMGEFNAYVKVRMERTGTSGEIFIAHGDWVELLN